MKVTVNIYHTDAEGSAGKLTEEMIVRRIAKIRFA